MYSNIIRVLAQSNYEFSVYEHRPDRENYLPRMPDDGPRYIYHSEAPGPGDYCLKRGPLPFLWHMDEDGYSGWSTIACDQSLQERSLGFDPDSAKAVIADFQSRLAKAEFSLIPQPDAKFEGEAASLDDYVFFPLQVNNDKVLELADCPQFELIRKAGIYADKLGRHLVIKRHPLCTSETVSAAIDSVIESGYVHLSAGPTPELIKRASTVMLTNSSVGVQALILNVPVFAFGGSEYAHMTTRLSETDGVERVFLDTPCRPHNEFAGGIAYLLSEYFVDMHDPTKIAARIESQIKDCRSLTYSLVTPVGPQTRAEDDLRELTLKRALNRESVELLDFVLMTYSDLSGEKKTRVARMLSRLARTGIATERIIAHSDAEVSNRCLTYLEQKNDDDGLIRVARARLKSNPSDWRAAYMLAKSYFAKSDDERALEIARKAAETDGAPSAVRLFYARRSWSMRSFPDETVKSIIQDVLRMDPKNADANWLQARAFFADKKITQALRSIQVSLDTAPNNPRYRKFYNKIAEVT